MKKRQVIALALAVVTAFSMSACGGSSSDYDATAGGSATEEEAAATDDSEAVSIPDGYDESSESIYTDVLGDFNTYLQEALETDNVSERWALMAISEAKFLESGASVPTTSQGGTYAISRVAPYTIDYALWGSDYERFHQALVTTEPILAADRAEMKAKWAELKGTGTYADWAEQYLIDKGYTLKDTYSLAYNSDPVTWDILSSSLSVDGEACVNTYDSLMEYDEEGNLMPALAESYEVSDDGLTYTFHLRQGVKWVDSQGREVADVVADDFVAGMQHMMDAAGGLEYLVDGVIVNATGYLYGDISDFSEVGVSAPDDYTVVYTLEAPCSYFTTMLGYSVFAPMSRSYYESQGGKFGTEYDSSASDYLYGTDPDHIAYCGPYIVTNTTEKNTIVFSANESYWNKDDINIHTITWLYSDGTDPTKTYNDMKDGTIDGCSLQTATLTLAKSDTTDDGTSWYDKYAYVSNTDATTFQAFFNLNRNTFANTNDTSKVVSEQSDEDAERTSTAMQNQHFRLALCFGFDRSAYNAQQVGDDISVNSLRNSITPGTFVSLEEDTTVAINGTDTTFPAGTFYGEIVQAQLDADGVPITAWDPNADDGIGSSDGYDGWYNIDNAQAEMAEAVEELAAEGVTVDADNPIILDIPYPSNDEVYTNKANAVKQSIEASLNGLVKVNLVECTDYDQWLYAGYYVDYGYEMNYDIYDCSGWAPDYGDPYSYLGCFLPDYAGYMTKCFGIY